jgi:hypothetical protein
MNSFFEEEPDPSALLSTLPSLLKIVTDSVFDISLTPRRLEVSFPLHGILDIQTEFIIDQLQRHSCLCGSGYPRIVLFYPFLEIFGEACIKVIIRFAL